ncbi:hypothetical protein O181_067251 [Austropuccinia psidii MF-1]|uniref:Uncharacterized protein n=1 Tax=Austropuccinia psidii MF-1 TaxID=1389203 RepID=A0A9Q3ESI8_9BASI|nr:hypothetical protein [Austropuccinia psidii MF-1]
MFSSESPPIYALSLRPPFSAHACRAFSRQFTMHMQFPLKPNLMRIILNLICPSPAAAGLASRPKIFHYVATHQRFLNLVGNSLSPV